MKGVADMITAAEARDRCKQNIEREIENIEQKIIYAVDRGLNYISISPSISLSATQILRELGYRVESFRIDIHSYTNVRW